MVIRYKKYSSAKAMLSTAKAEYEDFASVVEYDDYDEYVGLYGRVDDSGVVYRVVMFDDGYSYDVQSYRKGYDEYELIERSSGFTNPCVLEAALSFIANGGVSC